MDPDDTSRRAQKKKKGAGASRSALKDQRATYLIVITTFTPLIAAIITLIAIAKRSKPRPTAAIAATRPSCVRKLVTAYCSIAIRSVIVRSYSKVSLSHSLYTKLEKYNQPNPSINLTRPLPHAI